MSINLYWAFCCLSALALLVTKEVCWEAKRRRLPASIPWVGPRNEVFSMLRAWIREYKAGLNTVEEGYNKYNTKGKPFAVLDTAGRSQVILPKELMRWMVSQAEGIFSQREVLNTKFAVKYLSPPIPTKISHQVSLALRRDLTRNLGRTQKTVFDAMRLYIDAIIQRDDSSWHEVDLVQILQPAIASATNRILVGQVLCTNATFLESFGSFSDYLGIAAVVIGQYVPYFLAAPFGYLASIGVRLYRRKALKYLIPEVQARMDAIELAKTDPAFVYKPPVDVIQWSIMTCENATALQISDALLSLALGAIHTSIMVSTSAFIDILSTPPELGCFDALYDEAVSVFRTEEDWGKLASLHKLNRTDSALRESMRHNPLFGRGTMQEVMRKNGVILPDGNHVPQGAWLGVSLTGIAMDERYYPDPHKYDPWRFSRARDELALRGETFGSKLVDYDKLDNKLNGGYLSTSEDRFATFGFGKHSCPGRWFASHLMKLTLAYTALHYEIAPIKSRPQNMIVGDCIVAPRNLNIQIRRRKPLV